MTALDWHERGMLRNDAIVVTVMSNLGLRRALADAGVGIVETPVGDRNVTAAMAAHDLAIGGEQSGHIVFADLATTGDGVLTGLIVADLRAPGGGVPLSALAGGDDAAAAGAGERAGRAAASISSDAPGVQEAVADGRGRARRPGPGAGAQLGNRTGRAGDGRGADRRRGRGRGSPRPGRARAALRAVTDPRLRAPRHLDRRKTVDRSGPPLCAAAPTLAARCAESSPWCDAPPKARRPSWRRS